MIEAIGLIVLVVGELAAGIWALVDLCNSDSRYHVTPGGKLCGDPELGGTHSYQKCKDAQEPYCNANAWSDHNTWVQCMNDRILSPQQLLDNAYANRKVYYIGDQNNDGYLIPKTENYAGWNEWDIMWSFGKVVFWGQDEPVHAPGDGMRVDRFGNVFVNGMDG